MTNEELTAVYELKVAYEAYNALRAKVDSEMKAKGVEWAKEVAEASGADVSLRCAAEDGFIFTLVDKDGDKHELTLDWRDPSYEGKGRVLLINPPSIGSFSCHNECQYKYFKAIATMIADLAKWEGELLAITDWKDYQEKENRFYSVRREKEAAEREAEKAKAEAEAAAKRELCLSKMVVGAKMITKSKYTGIVKSERTIVKVTPKFMWMKDKYGWWSKDRKEGKMLINLVNGTWEFAE